MERKNSTIDLINLLSFNANLLSLDFMTTKIGFNFGHQKIKSDINQCFLENFKRFLSYFLDEFFFSIIDFSQ